MDLTHYGKKNSSNYKGGENTKGSDSSSALESYQRSFQFGVDIEGAGAKKQNGLTVCSKEVVAGKKSVRVCHQHGTGRAHPKTRCGFR